MGCCVPMGSARAMHAGWAVALVIVVSGCGLSDSAEAPTRSTLQLGPLPAQGAAAATPEPVQVVVGPPVPINGGAVAGAPAERITLPPVPGPPPIEMAFTGILLGALPAEGDSALERIERQLVDAILRGTFTSAALETALRRERPAFRRPPA